MLEHPGVRGDNREELPHPRMILLRRKPGRGGTLRYMENPQTMTGDPIP